MLTLSFTWYALNVDPPIVRDSVPTTSIRHEPEEDPYGAALAVRSYDQESPAFHFGNAVEARVGAATAGRANTETEMTTTTQARTLLPRGRSKERRDRVFLA